MKKIKGFTLLESLAVIGIIGVISTAIYNMRNIGNNYTDYRKEAANVIYKEINQSLKDFQRNKIWIDEQGNTHEISSFQIKFGTNNDLLVGTNGNYGTIGQSLEIGNTYLYCTNNHYEIVDCFSGDDISNAVNFGTGFFDSTTLIKNTKYTSSKKIKNINDFEFLIDGGYKVDAVNILKYGGYSIGDYIEGFSGDVKKAKYAESNAIAMGEPTQDKLPESCKDTYNKCYDLYSGGNTRQPCLPGSTDHKCCYGYISLFGITIRPSSCNTSESCEKCMSQNDYDKLLQRNMEKCLKNYYLRNCDDVLENNNIIVDPSELGASGPEGNKTTYSLTIYAAEKNGTKDCKATHKSQSLTTYLGNLTLQPHNQWPKAEKDTITFCEKLQNGDATFEVLSNNALQIAISETTKNIEKEIEICGKISELKPEDLKDLTPEQKGDLKQCCNELIKKTGTPSLKEPTPIEIPDTPAVTTKGKTRQPVGKITINTITKTASVERCNNDRESNGIDCGTTYCY